VGFWLSLLFKHSFLAFLESKHEVSPSNSLGAQARRTPFLPDLTLIFVSQMTSLDLAG
jgi:hypothetical protein